MKTALRSLLEHPWVLFLIGIADFITAAALKEQSLLGDHTAEVLKEFGIAVAIIGFVAWSIEKARVAAFADALSREVNKIVQTFSSTLSSEVSRKLDEIKDATVYAVIQGPLPPRYYEEIQEIVFNNQFVRETWTVTFDFHWFPVEGREYEFLHLSIEQSYGIKNMKGPRSYPIEHYESKDWDDAFPGSTRFRYLRAEVDDQPGVLVINEPAEGRTPPWKDTTNNEVRFRVEREIQPRSVLAVDVGSEKIMRDRQYESRMIGEPTLQAKFLIRAPADLSVKIEIPEMLLGSSQEKVKPVPVPTTEGRVSYYWHVARPLPPSACLFVSWQRKEGRDQSQTAIETPDAASEPAPELGHETRK